MRFGLGGLLLGLLVLAGCANLQFSGGPYAQLTDGEGSNRTWTVGVWGTFYPKGGTPGVPAVPSTQQVNVNVNNASESNSVAVAAQNQSQTQSQRQQCSKCTKHHHHHHHHHLKRK